jgi:hypothetical protein
LFLHEGVFLFYLMFSGAGSGNLGGQFLYAGQRETYVEAPGASFVVFICHFWLVYISSGIPGQSNPLNSGPSHRSNSSE